MKGKKWILQLSVPLLSLCILLFLLATTPTDPNEHRDRAEISVIWREDSPVWATVRKGMEQAAADLGAELRFLSPQTPNDAQEQAELLRRELESGAQGVILDPADCTLLNEQAAQSGRILLTLESPIEGTLGCVGPEPVALGLELAKMAFNGVPMGGLVLLLDSAPGDNAVRTRLEACQNALEAAGRRVVVCPVTAETPIAKIVPPYATQMGAVAMVAFEPSALEAAAEVVRSLDQQSLPQGQYPPLLYGFGSSPAIAAGLEQSRVTAIQAQNDFAAGYVAVEKTLRAVRREGQEETEPLPVFLVRRENMYDAERQKLLFPVS